MKKCFLTLLFVAMFSLVACDNVVVDDGNKNEDIEEQPSEERPEREEIAFINNLIAQYGDFDADTFVQNLPGVWEVYAVYRYHISWTNVMSVLRYQGDEYMSGGLVCEQYTFNADGTGKRYIEVVDPTIGSETTEYVWRYDTENRELILTVSDDWIIKRTISAFSDEYFAWDYKNSIDQHFREVYKRVTDK